MRSGALLVFLLLSAVSLLADIVYEGGRSVSGSFLQSLNAPLLATSILAVGELISHSFRLIAGVLGFRLASPRAYWMLLFTGYGLNASIPLLALASDWRVAVALYLAERAGKGLRTPIRDSLLAEVSEGVGRGKAFAIHEVLDQAGGVIGPLAIGVAVERAGGSYDTAFGLMWLPFVASMVVLYLAWIAYNSRSRVDLKQLAIGEDRERLGRHVLLVLSTLLLGAGFLHWTQASYRLREVGVSDSHIAWLYALAMLCDAIAAIPLGLLFDQVGLRSLAAIPILIAMASSFFTLTPPVVFALAWGAAMASIETILKASIAVATQARERPLVYALAYISFGLGWSIGNVVMSLVGVSLVYVLAVEAMALAVILLLVERAGRIS